MMSLELCLLYVVAQALARNVEDHESFADGDGDIYKIERLSPGSTSIKLWQSMSNKWIYRGLFILDENAFHWSEDLESEEDWL